jgi:tRNA A37 threonylcarbamoyladenosine dehydratase
MEVNHSSAVKIIIASQAETYFHGSLGGVDYNTGHQALKTVINEVLCVVGCDSVGSWVDNGTEEHAASIF